MEGGKLSVTFPNYHHTSEISEGKLVEVNPVTCLLVVLGIQCDESSCYTSLGSLTLMIHCCSWRAALANEKNCLKCRVVHKIGADVR